MRAGGVIHSGLVVRAALDETSCNRAGSSSNTAESGSGGALYTNGTTGSFSDLTFTKVSAGAFHTCGLTGWEDGGALYCWGRNTGSFGQDAGQLGDGTFTDRAVPTRVVESSAERGGGS